MLDLATAVLAISVHVDSAVRAVTTPTPSPSPLPEFDETIVTPGPAGFIAIFGIAVVTVLLILDMVRRVRRVRLRDGLALEAEIAQAARAVEQDAAAKDPKTP